MSMQAIKATAHTESEHAEAEMMTAQLVQSFCVLAVLRESDLVVQQISKNTETLLGVKPDKVAGDTLDTILSDKSVEEIRACLRAGSSNEELQAAMPLTLTAQRGSKWYGILHRPPGSENDRGGCAVLELEPFLEKEEDTLPNGFAAFDAYPAALMLKGRERLQGESDEAALCRVVTEVLSEVSGFDRVCCFAFSKEGHGHVRSETLRDAKLTPYLGLHFPATDIPVFSRAIFYASRARLILDSTDEGVGLFPELHPEKKHALDMYYCNSRAPARCVREFNTNSNSRTQLVYSIIANNKLWGLVSMYHHNKGMYVSYKARTSLVGIVQLFSRCLESATRDQTRLAKERALLAPTELLAIGSNTAGGEAVTAGPPDIGLWAVARPAEGSPDASALNASIAAIIPKCSGSVVLDLSTKRAAKAGEVVEEGELEWLAQLLHSGKSSVRRYPDNSKSASRHDVWVSDNAPTDCRVDGKALSWKGGFLAVSVYGNQNGGQGVTAFWFRRPALQSVDWIGENHKPLTEADKGKLGPQNSFVLWKAAVGERCEYFSDDEVATARLFASAIASAIAKKQ
eukprot:tig00021133_g18910.t1